MRLLRDLFIFIRKWTSIIFDFIATFFVSAVELRMEVTAVRSQLALFQKDILANKISIPKVDNVFRQLWVIISKCFHKWKDALMIVQPETVIKWHKTAFKLYWAKKCKSAGRPPISKQMIALIKKIHKENPLLSPEKIHEKIVQLGIVNPPAPKTISKYIGYNKKTPIRKQTQSWRNFLKNHSKKIWAIDFFTVPTLFFKVLYVFIVISHDRRKIEHINITENPDSVFVAQQIREATPFGHQPKYLIHDRGSQFTSKYFKEFLENANIKAKMTAYQAPWQNGICERAIGIIRQDLLNHVIPLNRDHLMHLLKDYVNNYYNTVRTHQGIECETPIYSDKPPLTLVENTKLKIKPIVGGLYHSYEKVA